MDRLCSKLVSLLLSVTFIGLDTNTLTLLRNLYIRNKCCLLVSNEAEIFSNYLTRKMTHESMFGRSSLVIGTLRFVILKNQDTKECFADFDNVDLQFKMTVLNVLMQLFDSRWTKLFITNGSKVMRSPLFFCEYSLRTQKCKCILSICLYLFFFSI